MTLTAAHLHRLAPLCRHPETHAEALTAAIQGSTINSPRRLAHFLGQILHETGNLARLEEDLNYSTPERLDAMFRAVKGMDDALGLIAQGQEAIANRVYAGRNGNGDEASGDGWKYRGRGLIQITGRAMYRACSEGLQQPLLDRPELLLDPELAALSAAWYWTVNDCNLYADRNNFVKVTEIVNGGRNGLVDRQRYLETCQRILEQRTTTSAS